MNTARRAEIGCLALSARTAGVDWSGGEAAKRRLRDTLAYGWLGVSSLAGWQVGRLANCQIGKLAEADSKAVCCGLRRVE